MSIKIFITGKPRVGKSTLVKKIYDDLKDKFKIGGIITLEISKNNRRIGFKVIDLFSKREEIFSSIYFKTNYRVSKYFVDVEIFEKIAINAINFALENCDIIIIDEIGKMEMFSKKFEDLIYKVLNSEKNIIAVLHREYVGKFGRYGEIKFLKRENFDEIYNYIKFKMLK